MASHLGNTFSRRRRIAIIVTLGMLTGLGPFTIDLYLPAFPALKTDLGISDAQVQLTLSATTLGFATGQLLVGPLSDRLGRRLPLIVCSILHVVSSVLVAVAPSIEFLTAMRLLQGVGAAGGAVVAMAMARDLFSGRPLVVMLSRLALISGLAPIVAPIVGSWMVSFTDWRGVFWGLAAYGSVVIVLIVVMTVETRPPSERTRGGLSRSAWPSGRCSPTGWRWEPSSWRHSPSARCSPTWPARRCSCRRCTASPRRGFGTVFAICSFGVFVGVQTRQPAGAALGSAVGAGPATSLMVTSGVAVLVVDAANVGFVPLVPALWILTFGFGLSAPCGQILLLHNHRQHSGTAASLMGAVTQVVGSTVGPLIGLFAMTSAVPMGIGILICALLATSALWLVLRPRSVPNILGG